jgi:hypothetical protein
MCHLLIILKMRRLVGLAALVLLIVWPSLNLRANPQSNLCAQTREWAQDVVRYLRTTADVEDNRRYFEALRTAMRDCQISEAELGFGRRASLNELERLSLEYTRIRAEDRVHRLAPFQDVSQDVETALGLRRRLGLSTNEMETHLRSRAVEGREATARESQYCRPVDLRGPRLGPVRDQDSIGWCYAFSAADLLSYRLGERISAADLAVQHNAYDLRARARTWVRSLGGNSLPAEGGWPKTAIDAAAQRGGACRERDFRSDDTGYNNLMDAMRLLQRGRDRDTEMCEVAACGVFPRLSTSEIQDVLQSSPAAATSELADRACRPRIPLEGIRVAQMYRPTSRTSTMIEKVDELLNRNEPIEASYQTGCVEAADCDGRGGLHSSLIVGRRFNSRTGACEYLIRNSWGRSCLSQGRGMDCEEGNVWVPKHQLHQGLFGVTYLK